MVYTIGYEGVSIDTFVDYLACNNIKALIDVRMNPISRKPGFSKTRLTAALGSKGIRYVPMKEFGCPKDIRDQYRSDSDWSRYTKDYNEHMQLNLQNSLAGLADLVKTESAALMCFEKDPSMCHRSLVTTSLENQFKIPVKHLIPTIEAFAES